MTTRPSANPIEDILSMMQMIREVRDPRTVYMSTASAKLMVGNGISIIEAECYLSRMAGHTVRIVEVK